MFTWEALYWFVRITWDAARQNAVTYFLLAGVYWLVFYVVFRSRVLHRKIVARMPAGDDVRREVLRSLASLVIFGAMAAAAWVCSVAWWGRTPVYFNVSNHAWNWFGQGSDGGWSWFALSIVAMIFFHDAYFYWTHRLMHHPRLFRRLHLLHHRSTNPTPFAAYSFNAGEAVVQAGIFPLVTYTMPIHIGAFGLFMLWQIGFNVAGHCGYEFFPRWFLDTRWGKFLNTPTHHVMHHQHVRTNFGLYFNLWDRLMGTNDARYEEQFRAITSRKPRTRPTVEIAHGDASQSEQENREAA